VVVLNTGSPNTRFFGDPGVERPERRAVKVKYTTRMKINDIKAAVKDLEDNESKNIVAASEKEILNFLTWLKDVLNRKTINK